MKPTENVSDNELLRLMQTGDERAFASLYQRRHAAIYRFVLQMCGSTALAEDVTQEVFITLIRNRKTSDGFDPARGSLSSFLYGIARNQMLRRLQRERFYTAIEPGSDDYQNLPEPGVGPLEKVTRTETIESVRRAVLSLPERYREVVVLCDLEEMSYAEAADVLSCAIGTVRSRLHRARILLIEKLRPEEAQTSADEVKSARCFA